MLKWCTYHGRPWGVVVYNHAKDQNLEKQYTLYTHKWPHFGFQIPYTRFKIPLYTAYLKALADLDLFLEMCR